MRFHRFLRRECIRLSLRSDALPPPPENLPEERQDWYYKEAILEELSEILDASGEVASAKRIYKDLLNAEKTATSGIGDGIAIPHVKTLRARSFVMGFCRSSVGLPFDAVDGGPVRFFFPMVAPPYDDKVYVRVYKELGRLLLDPSCREVLAAAETEDDVIWGLQTFAEI